MDRQVETEACVCVWGWGTEHGDFSESGVSPKGDRVSREDRDTGYRDRGERGPRENPHSLRGSCRKALNNERYSSP